MSAPKLPRTPRDLKCVTCDAKPGERCHGTKRNVHGSRVWDFNQHRERERARAADAVRRQLLLERLEEHTALVALAKAAEAMADEDEWCQGVLDAVRHPLVQRALEKAGKREKARKR